MTSKDRIKRNFSRYAAYYDRYSNIQDLCALHLIDMIQQKRFNRILDIGCGTGNYTKLLRRRFPLAKIKAMDMSHGMVEAANRKLSDENVEFIAADAEKINLKDQIDLITSNVSFQWFEDLEKTVTRYRDLLAANGHLLFSIFGPKTFIELDLCLKALFNEDISICSCTFMDSDKIKSILEKIFDEVLVKKMVLREECGSLQELLMKIKYTGVRGNGVNGKSLWTPGILKNLEKIYRKNAGSISVTYELILCQGYLL